MAERKREERDEEQHAAIETAPDQARQAARQTTRETADTSKELIETAADASQEAWYRAEAEIDEQSEQAVVLAKEFIETQSDAVEVAMRTVESATDVGANSTRLWASLSSAWIGLLQRQMQFSLEGIRRLRESRALTRPLELQARFLQDSASQWGRTQSRLAETARENARAAGHLQAAH